MAAATRKRGTYRKTQATRQAILDAALEVFGRSGYRKGSLREIAGKVSMSEAGMLHHFPSKSALLAAVLEHRDDESRGMVDFHAPDPRDTLRSALDVARDSASRPGVVELFSVLSAEATAPSHPAHAYFQERYVRLREEFLDVYARLQESGGLKEGSDPDRLSRRTVALWDGLQVQWLLDRGSLDVVEDLADFFDSILVHPL